MLARIESRQVFHFHEAEPMEPSPVVELNRAVAIAMCDGPESGPNLIDSLLAQGELANLPPGAFRSGGFVPQARQNC